jgi:Amt family ammonium transporter
MIAGLLGGFMTGILATVEGCAAFGLTNPGGAIAGNGRQVWVQLVGALFIIGWNLAVTLLILFFIKYVLRVPLKFDEATLRVGDDAIHGEEAYVLDGLPLLHHHDGHVRHEEPTEEKSGYTPPDVHVAEV